VSKYLETREILVQALEESEERLSILASLSYDVLWQWDIVSGVHKWIGDIDICLGYEKNEFPRTIEAWENIIHQEDRERVAKKLQEHHETRVKWNEEYRVVRKDGEIRWWEDRGVTRWDEDGKPLVMTGVILDITEKVLHEKDKLLSLAQMGASIAHEFNNPLQGIRNIIEILCDSSGSEENEKLGKIGLSECDRLSKLVCGLMDFYKPSNSKYSLIDVKQSVEIVLTLKEENLQKRSIQVKKIFSDDLPKVEISEDQIKQVVFNVLQNAIDSIVNEGQITVTTKKNNSYVILEIKDTGKGISKQDQKNIFEPFFSTKAAEKGTGLGLSITYGIIKGWNGDINVKSKLNKGTTVIIKLPIKKIQV
jgi:PAS domain S-box-containing protein